MPIESVLRPILDTVLDAVVVMDRTGKIREWNSHAESMFGWSRGDAIGHRVEIIIPPALREAHRRGLERFNRKGVGRVIDTRLELSGLRRDGSEFPLELSITLLSREGREVFVAFLRDISERQRLEQSLRFQVRESQLLLELSDLANRQGSLEEALGAALDAVCELTGWPVGHAFLVDEDLDLRSGVWSKGARGVAPDLFRKTEESEFRLGVGLPGRVLDSGLPMWVSNAEEDENFPRRGLGFASAFAFPIFSGDRCIAVFEFFSRDARQPDEALLLSARAIGAQVGRVFERKRSEELRELLLSELDHRVKNILSVVRGIAHLSLNASSDIAEAQESFDRRLDSIGRANAILRGESGNSALIGDIVREALAGAGAGEGRVAVAGPELCIDSSLAIMVALAVHELCTNAFKYGALSSRKGRVAVRWQVSEDDASRFDFHWDERGGPSVEPSNAKGFGSRILSRGIELASGGEAETRFEPEGLRYRLAGARHNGPPKQARAA